MRQDRQVPYAVMNYRKIAGGEYFFVDHMRFLRELEQHETPAFLHLRVHPRVRNTIF